MRERDPGGLAERAIIPGTDRRLGLGKASGSNGDRRARRRAAMARAERRQCCEGVRVLGGG